MNIEKFENLKENYKIYGSASDKCVGRRMWTIFNLNYNFKISTYLILIEHIINRSVSTEKWNF